MNTRKSSILVATLAVATFSFGITVLAQNEATSEAARKVKAKVSPTYPELARRMNISGRVKLQVVISPDGRVKSANGLGGHPILIQACQDAVMKWEFLPATAETTQVIEFDFHYP